MTATTRAPYRPRHAAAAVPVGAPRPDEQPGRPPLRIVTPGELSPRARRRRARLIAGAVALFACLGVFGVVAFHVVLTQGQLQLDRLEDRAAEAQARYDRSRLLVAELESPERIVAVAQERLGMVPPPDVTYLSPTGIRSAPGAGAGSPHERGMPSTSTSWPAVKAHLATGR